MALCPFCQTDIPFAAIKCPNCTANLEGNQQWDSTRRLQIKVVLVGLVVAVGVVVWLMNQ